MIQNNKILTNNNKRNKRVHIYINKTACKLKDII